MDHDHDLIKTLCMFYENDELCFKEVSQERLDDCERFPHLLVDS